jgi:hypothetical protein
MSASLFRQRATVPSALITLDREHVDGIARVTRSDAVAS